MEYKAHAKNIALRNKMNRHGLRKDLYDENNNIRQNRACNYYSRAG